MQCKGKEKVEDAEANKSAKAHTRCCGLTEAKAHVHAMYRPCRTHQITHTDDISAAHARTCGLAAWSGGASSFGTRPATRSS